VISSVAAKFGVKQFAGTPGSAGIPISSNAAYGATSNTTTFTIAGILIMVATFGAVFGGGVTLLTDRELGNLKAFLITPINKFSILFSKVLYGTVQSVFSAYVALAIGLLYGATIATGIGGMLEIMWFVFLAGFGFSSIAIAIAVRTKQVQTFQLLAQTIVMPLSFLGGALVPVSSLPAFLYPLTVINPLTYAVNAVRGIMIKGYLPFGVFVVDSAILMAFAVLMLAVSALLFRGMNE
jgi:ABC-2 type transport system permease protein